MWFVSTCAMDESRSLLYSGRGSHAYSEIWTILKMLILICFRTLFMWQFLLLEAVLSIQQEDPPPGCLTLWGNSHLCTSTAISTYTDNQKASITQLFYKLRSFLKIIFQNNTLYLPENSYNRNKQECRWKLTIQFTFLNTRLLLECEARGQLQNGSVWDSN